MIKFLKWLYKLHTKNNWRKITDVIKLYEWYKLCDKTTIIVHNDDFDSEELAEQYVLDWFKSRGKIIKKLKEPIITKEGFEIFAKGNENDFEEITNGNVKIKVFKNDSQNW